MSRPRSSTGPQQYRSQRREQRISNRQRRGDKRRGSLRGSRSGKGEIIGGTQIIGISAAWIIDAASWIVHVATSTSLRTEHTALGIGVGLIHNGVVVIVSAIRLQPKVVERATGAS